MKRLKDIKDLVQEAIDNGATTVEQVHKSLASKPFELLEKINVSGSAMERLEGFQQQSIGNVYDFIRAVNEKVGDIASQLLGETDRDQTPGEAKASAPTQCGAMTKKGGRCKNRPKDGSDYCRLHQPK